MRVLEYAREMGVLSRRGGVAVDGTKVTANASKHAAVSHGRAGEMIEELKGEVQELMALAEQIHLGTGKQRLPRAALARVPVHIPSNNSAGAGASSSGTGSR